LHWQTSDADREGQCVRYLVTTAAASLELPLTSRHPVLVHQLDAARKLAVQPPNAGEQRAAGLGTERILPSRATTDMRSSTSSGQASAPASLT
jgi:hypothetical protein